MTVRTRWTRRVVAGTALAVAAVLAFVGASSRAEPQAPDAQPPAKKAPPKFQFVAYDGFKGKLSLNWQPVRHDPTHISLTKNPGKLTITTQQGTIHADEKARNEPLAKNLFVIDNPLAKDVNFTVTTCISSFTPETPYQQAGLLLYDDDDNYLKWGYEYNWPKGEGQTFCLVAEAEAKPAHHHVESGNGLKQVWLRLTKRGNEYEYSSSTDGEAFTSHGKETWGNGAPKKIGILAKNGGPDGVPEIDAGFEFFELRAPAPAAKKK